MEAREAAAAVRALAAALGAPVLLTYKAKGVVADDDPLFAGLFTGGAAEAPLVEAADAIVLAGADPVEFIPAPWRSRAPVIDVARFRRPRHYTAPAVVVEGAIGPALEALAAAARRSDWTAAGGGRDRGAAVADAVAFA
ncbi:hypothetical protein FK498_19060, partial [Elioraea sp. Yellowstone]